MQDLIITNAGQELMAKLIAGETTANFTRLLSSSKDYSGVELASLISLEEVRQNVLVSGTEITSDTTVSVQARLDNTLLTEGYYIRALGLFAEDADGNTILYAVSIADTVADWMPAFGGTTPTGYSYTFNVKVSNSAAITIVIDPTGVPTMAQFNEVKEIATADHELLGEDDISELSDEGTVTAALLALAAKEIAGKTAAERNSFVVIKDITADFYKAGSDIRKRIAEGDFTGLNPGNYIIGKTTGTKWWVVECDYWYGNRTSGHGKTDYAESTHHLCIMPQQLIGVTQLLWSGATYQGSGVNNTVQGCAPWNQTNVTTGALKGSYIYGTILPLVYTKWLKADFVDHGIKVLGFYNLDTNAVNTAATCQGYSAWSGASSGWEWTDEASKCALPSIQNLTGSDGFQSSGYDTGVQKEQLAIFKAGMSYQEFLGAIENTQYNRCTWTKNVAYSTNACNVNYDGYSYYDSASLAYGVRPLAFIA